MSVIKRATGKMPYFLEADDLVVMAVDTDNVIVMVDDVLSSTDSLEAGPIGVGPGSGQPNLVSSSFYGGIFFYYPYFLWIYSLLLLSVSQ